MTGFVKPLLLSAFAAGTVAVGQPPAAPPAPPAPPGFPGGPGGSPFAPVGGTGGFFGSAEGNVVFARAGFGDDPRTRELAKKLIAATDDEARTKLRGDLKAALGKAFDDRLTAQEKQVAELEAQLKRLKETVGKRKEAKPDIVADRLAALEKEAKGLGW